MALAALIISIIALVVALPTIAQMVWGKPDLRIAFDSKDVEGGKVMTCQLVNLPIIQGFRKKVGVRTTPIEDLVAHFSISEYDSDREIYGRVPHILKYDGAINAQRIDLPASIFPAYFGVASVYHDTGTVTVFEKNDVALPIGKYVITVHAQFQENQMEGERNLTVHEEYPYACWA